MDFSTEFDARLGEGEVTLTERDVRLLRCIDDCGSINGAADELGRSYARAQQRIVELEGAFGELVVRTRGGAGGGGSQLTDRARELLSQYDRLCAEFDSVVETTETVLTGRVLDREGDLATVETPAGRLRAISPTDDDEVRLTIRADAVTLQAPDVSPAAGSTSARNRLEGTVVDVEPSAAVAVVAVDVGAPTSLSAIVTTDSVEKLGLTAGTRVVASFKATATHGVPTG